MKIRQIRHATIRVSFGGVEFLVDPWLVNPMGGFTLSESQDADEAINSTEEKVVMPMCDLPIPLSEVLYGVDAHVLTHLHPVHFDMSADGNVGWSISKALPIFVQNDDEAEILKQNKFSDVRCFSDEGVEFRGVILRRTYAKYGSKVLRAPASGVFFSATAEDKTLWVLGDTVWCDEVAEKMRELKPDVVVLSACDSQLKSYGRLAMDDADVEAVCRAIPEATIIINHMDTIATAHLHRATLKAALEKRGIVDRVLIPEDGDEISL